MEAQISGLKTLLHWTFSPHDVRYTGTALQSHALSIPDIPNCKFHILAENRADKLTITVRKSTHQQAEINVILMVDRVRPYQSHLPRDTNWIIEEVFHFPSSCLNHGTSITVICDITWNKPLSGLYNDVKPFLLNRSCSDFTIVIREEELPVHKIILGAQSSVFLAMFESDMKESKENKVTIEDVRLDVMKNVLSFLYTGSQEALNDSQMAMDIWIVAEKYDIEKLKDLCEAKLLGLITESNVLEIFQHAVDHGLKTIRSACLNFIQDNKKKMSDEPHFKTSFFEKPQLMYTLIYDLLQSNK